MEIISTNISKIKTVVYEGKEVKTGIFKEAVKSELVIEKLNIVGDEQADLVNHGGIDKAIYAFSAGHYPYWKETLQVTDLPPGSFGENFTVTNLNEDNFKIGDQYRFGTALLEVSQPRIPCFKLGIALKNKQAPKLFIENAATGVYFRVLESGKVKTGDAVILEKKTYHDITVKKLFRAYFDKSFGDSEPVLSAAYELDELAAPWKEMLRKRLIG